MIYSTDHETVAKRFWNGKNKQKEDLSIREDGGKIEAIDRAIRDLMARTLKPKPNVTDNLNDDIRNSLKPLLEAWLKQTPSLAAYDEWHRDACSAVLTVLRKHYTNRSCPEEVAYGKAQKIVNMTMKELYCLQDAKDFEDHFQFCHMALDSFALEWFCREVMPWMEKIYNPWVESIQQRISDWLLQAGYKKKGREQAATFAANQLENMKDDPQKLEALLQARDWEKILENMPELLKPYQAEIWEEVQTCIRQGHLPAKLRKGGMVAWSVIPKEAGSTYSYDQYVRWIRLYFESCGANPYHTPEPVGKKLTAFQAEFYIWPEIQLHLSAEALFGQDIGKDKTVDEFPKPPNAGKAWKEFETLRQEGNIDQAFEKCKEIFKASTLEEKMEFLKDRVKTICDDCLGQKDQQLEAVG